MAELLAWLQPLHSRNSIACCRKVQHRGHPILTSQHGRWCSRMKEEVLQAFVPALMLSDSMSNPARTPTASSSTSCTMEP